MNRRSLLKAIPAIAAIPFTVEGVEGQAYELTPGKNYLFVFKAGSTDIRQAHIALCRMGLKGAIQVTYDPPEESLKIYELEP